jgi:hypothetical protein
MRVPPAVLCLSLLALSAALPPAPARADEYKVVYLNYEARHVEEGKKEPIVLEDGLLLSGPKQLHPPKGCQPLKACRGTFEIPELGKMLDALYRRNWELVSVQPVTEGALKGGYLAFLKRRALPAVPSP